MMANGGSLDGNTILEPETIELMQQDHLKNLQRTYGLGGWADGSGTYYWGGAAGTKFWVSTPDKAFGLFMVQRTGYETTAEKVFQRLSRRALEN
jgi:CubicO group peptidase (beta-lactamase class C family)